LSFSAKYTTPKDPYPSLAIALKLSGPTVSSSISSMLVPSSLAVMPLPVFSPAGEGVVEALLASSFFFISCFSSAY